ncbi:uncharacterized protein LOC144654950 [Oculina patagonica]
MLPEGIKVLNNSYGSVTLERITKNNTNGHAQTLCEVHYSDNSVTSHIYEINFNVRCVWIQKGRDLNLTRILLSMLSCERVVDIEWYSINGSKFAYCKSCQSCTKTNSTDGNHLVPAFWNRLQVTGGSLLLTGIQENNDGLAIRVKVYVKTSGKPADRDLGIDIASVHEYTIRIFVNISRGPPANVKTTTAAATTTVPATTATTEEAIQACFNGPLTLHCELVTNLSAVYELHWKIKLPGTGWNEFSYCNKSSTNCIVTRPMLPEGIKVLNNSYGSVTLERITKNNTNGHAQTLCEVHYSDNSVTSHIYEINFNVRCVWIQKGRDLNLTRILLSMLSCERVVDIEWYSINGSKFAYCKSCQSCTKTNSTDGNHLVPAFWNRLQVTGGSLLLTGIQENNDGLAIRVKVYVKTSGKPADRDLGIDIASVHEYTIRIFVNISRGPPANVKTTTAAATTTVPATTATTEEAIQACFNGPLTLHCELVTNLSAVYELHWKIKLPGTGWNEFSYCNKSSTNCIVTRPMLPEGIKVLNNSYGSVTLERITKNNTNGHAQTLCEVHYSDNSVTSHIYEINFNVRCVWIQKGRDLNLTRILLSMLSCERVVDIDWYSINGSKFAYCNSCQGCTKTKSTDDNHIPVLWNRLQVARGLLLLTRIQESDDGLTVRVEVHLKTSGKLTGRDFSTKKESVRQYTIRILVNISRGPPDEENKTLSTAPAKVCCVGANFPCKPKQIHWNNTEGKSDKCLDCPDCPAGSQPSVACGSSVKFGKPVYCVSCELGKTYSDKYDNAQCKACKKCSKGKAVKKNCTLFTNTECDTKCGHGFYTFPLISSCLPCKQCCNDGKDKFATECMNNKNKCKARHRRCAHVHAMSSKPRDRDSVTLPTTQPVPLEGEITTMSILFSEISEKLRTFITPTWSVDNKALTGEAVETGKQDGTSLVVILLTVALAMCLVVSSLVIAKKVILGKDFLRSSREQNLDHGGNNSIQRQPPPRSQWSASHTSGQVSASSFLNRPESSQPNPSESPPSSRSASPLLIRPESSQSNRPESPKISGSAGSPLASASPRADGSTLPQPNGYTSPQLNRSASHHPSWAASAQFCRSARQQIDDVTLEELEDNNMELFDWVCTRLDNGRVGFRRDYERLASKYKIIPTEAHNSLRNESLSEGFMMDGRTLTEEQKRKKREKDRERQREKRGRTTEEQHEAEIERRREVTRNRTEEQREARRKREREIRRNSTAENALLPYVPVSTMGSE